MLNNPPFKSDPDAGYLDGSMFYSGLSAMKSAAYQSAQQAAEYGSSTAQMAKLKIDESGVAQKFSETSQMVKENASYAAGKTQENLYAVKGKVDDGTIS